MVQCSGDSATPLRSAQNDEGALRCAQNDEGALRCARNDRGVAALFFPSFCAKSQNLGGDGAMFGRFCDYASLRAE